MKNNENRKALWLLLILVLTVSSCYDAPIAIYEPKNQDEREIISLLMQYQDARNRFDIESLLSILHERGSYSFECGLMISKAKLKVMLPALWTEIRSGNSAVIPMVHECINGDYYTSGELNNPNIKIDNDTADATVLFTKGVCRVALYFSLLKEKNRWMITRTEWGHS